MLSKRALAFIALAATAATVACSNLGMTTGVNVGPNFPSKTLYATNTNQNAISIYSGGKNGSGPSFNIGGGSTSLDGPQYLAFDRRQNLWVTNYNQSTHNAVLVEFAALGDRRRHSPRDDLGAGASARHRLYAEGANALSLELGRTAPADHGHRG